jgi:hypothetical protein
LSSNSSTSPNSDELDGSDVNFSFCSDPAVTGPNFHSADAHADREISESVRFGSVFASTAPEDTLDWALVKIDNPDIIPFASDLMINKVCLADRWVYPESLRGGGGGRVLICLGALEAVEGIVSEIASFSKAPGKRVFQELWQVKLSKGSFGKLRT